MVHTRALVRFSSIREIEEFVQNLNSDGTYERYTFEDFEGTHRVNARSYLGVLYLYSEYPDIFLVNETVDGKIPAFVDKYRPA